MTRLHVERARPEHLDAVLATYADARVRQRRQGVAHWPEFTNQAILAEMGAGNLLRVLDGTTLAGIFSVAYDDSAIWGELERGAHIYLHRVARVSTYAGPPLLDTVLDWARSRCRELGREGLRLDTWNDNPPLIAYYERHGFRYVGHRTLPADPRLLAHYHGLDVALMEEHEAPSPATSTSP